MKPTKYVRLDDTPGSSMPWSKAELRQRDRERKHRRECRHCGGPLPCWSPFGDARPGVHNKTDGDLALYGVRRPSRDERVAEFRARLEFRWALYVRASTEEQGRPHTSVQSQL